MSVVSAVRDFNGVGPFQLYLADRDGTNLRRILADLDNPFAAQWSPWGTCRGRRTAPGWSAR